MTLTHRLLRLILPASVALSGQAAFAQDDDKSEAKGWIVTIGGGGVFEPRFPGAKDRELRPWPIVNVRRAGSQRHFSTPDQSFGPGLINGLNFRLGPALNIANGRDEEDAIEGIGDVKTMVELGAFAEAFMSESFRFRGEVRKGLGGHKGLIGDLGADYIIGDPTKGTHFSVGPRLRITDARYNRAFYGVNAEQAALTGLAVHKPTGGVNSAGALAFAGVSLSEQFGLRAYGRYDRLLGSAADSPLVRSSVGSRNQFEAGLGLTYTFGL